MILDDLVAFPNLQSLQLKIGTSMPDECLQVNSSSKALSISSTTDYNHELA